jgi:signal transduction histidine kinase
VKSDASRLFFCQSIQDTVALYYHLPIRTLDLSQKKEIFSYCKDTNFLNLCYEDEDKFLASLQELLHLIPNFLYDKEIKNRTLLKKLSGIKHLEIEGFRKYLIFTKSSFKPFLLRSLGDSVEIRVLNIAFYIYVLFSADGILEEYPSEIKFFNFSYKIYRAQSSVFLIGPVLIDKSFKDDDKKLQYVKNIKNFFSLDLHTYELINLINHRNIISSNEFNTKAQNTVKVMKLAEKNFTNRFYKKSELRDIAANFISLSSHNSRKKFQKIDSQIIKNRTFENVSTQIKNNQILRDLEALEWFNDLTFRDLSFEKSYETYKNIALKFLKDALQSDGYLLCGYNHSQKSFKLLEHSKFDSKFIDEFLRSIDEANRDFELLKSSFTYDIINDYQKNKNPIRLIEDVSKASKNLCYKNSSIKSILSIPLVFDKRVFAVLHLIGFKKNRFDDIDKRFLLKLSSSLNKRYIENRFNSSVERMVSLLEGLNKTIDYRFLAKKTDQICENIASAFASDGAIIWFNKKEIFQTPRDIDQLSIISQINFLDEDESLEDELYVISSDHDENLIKKNSNRDIVVIDSISEKCTDNKKDRFFMKYKEQFEKKGIVSIMFVAIKNYEGKFSGAVMIFDKSYRNYNQLSQRMLKRISINIGSILNTVTYAKYRAKQLDERNLHESAQYLNIINSRARDLEDILKKLYIRDGYEKYKLFLNLEDIKDFTAFTRNYLFTIFKGGKFVVKKYDELVDEGIKAILKNKEHISVKKSVNQVLAIKKNEMNQIKDIIYKNKIEQNIYIKMPSQQFHDVLNNMISNAIKYGKIGTYIKLWDELNSPYFYNIYIENIGYKIDKSERDRIFEKGFRGRVTKEELLDREEYEESVSENKGIGLFYVKGIMKNGIKGNVKLLESNPIGTTEFSKNVFILKIPIKMTRKVRCKD